MSHTETHFGKLRKVDIGDSLENWCKEQCNKEGITELDDFYDDWVDAFRNNIYEKFILTEDGVYEIFDHIESEYGNIKQITKNPDGTYTFATQFHNGGTCLEECLEEGLMRINKQ